MVDNITFLQNLKRTKQAELDDLRILFIEQLKRMNGQMAEQQRVKALSDFDLKKAEVEQKFATSYRIFEEAVTKAEPSYLIRTRMHSLARNSLTASLLAYKRVLYNYIAGFLT